MTGGPAEKPLRKAGKVALALAESIRLMELEAGDQLLIDAALALATNFSAAVARICSSLAGDDQPSASEGPSPEFVARRRAGKCAYEKAMMARGMSQQRATILASACYLFEDLDD
jgi:hypothetical protein